MKVYIANFGRENLLWPLCRDGSLILAYEDEDTWPYWHANNRDAYVAHCVANKRTARGIVPPKPTASRWFNLPTIVSETAGDLWLHREKDELWWTTSQNGDVEFAERPAPWRNPNTPRIHLIQKPANEWRNVDERGAPLRWPGVHAKAREFLFTEGTLQELSPDHADYALSLVEGGDLSRWHARPDWKRRADRSGHGAVTTLDARQRAVARMVRTAEDTVRASLGPSVLQTPKRKRSKFVNHLAFQAYVDALVEVQDGRCAITELPLQFDGTEDDPEFLCSLDRIDSDGDYEEGNLQVVCRFVNRWKGSDADESFRRLMGIVRGRVG